MENLNAEMIKRGLECCANNDECVGEECPYYATGCENNMPKDALALITSQEQRIKELTEENEKLKKKCDLRERDHNNALDLLYKAEAEVERLTEENDVRKRCNIMLNNELRRIDNIKADTVRKMQERLKAYFGTYVLGYKIPLTEALKAVNQIAKEMLEGENEN